MRTLAKRGADASASRLSLRCCCQARPRACGHRLQTTPTDPPPTPAQTAATPADESKTRMEIYGFTMLDNGFDFEQNNPDWFDVVRPTKLPAFEDEFGEDHRWFESVRQSRFGVKTYTPTKYGELKTIFEFELFGVGVDAGQTTFRLAACLGRAGTFRRRAVLEHVHGPGRVSESAGVLGPNGLVWFRNVQFRWMPIQGDNELFIAARASWRQRRWRHGSPIASSCRTSSGAFRRPISPRTTRLSRDWGHVQVAGLVRRIDWDDVLADPFDLSGHGNRLGR